MSDFFFRTEDISPSEIMDYFVDNDEDRSAINMLKGRNPTVIIGSRGVGKSFLMRVAEQELLASFASSRVLPVYITFVTSSLLKTSDPDQFKRWMIARICSSVIRTVRKMGLLPAETKTAGVLMGAMAPGSNRTSIEKIIDDFEASWKNPGGTVDSSAVPDVEAVKEALEDLAEDLNVNRFALFMDEAAHIFLPNQQRQFFTLFRDLRSHCITCNAAVYPGVTSYGDFFQPSHDATMVSINRDVLSAEYVERMRRIVEKQADSGLLKAITVNGRSFATLAYAASGNPRVLLKTVAQSPKMSSSEVNNVVRDFYRDGIWAEHSALAEKYKGHRDIIDWGRNFLEDAVVPDLKAKNDAYLSQEKNSTAFVWIHRDAPEVVKQALRILCYTGVLTEHASGIKATRKEIGTRYIVNLGCLFALESTPASSAFEIAKALTPKRMAEFGQNHSAFSGLVSKNINLDVVETGFDIRPQLAQPSSVLDVTPWQLSKLVQLGLMTVGEVFGASEDKLKEAHYVGDVRARRMRNAAVSSVLEYLSG